MHVTRRPTILRAVAVSLAIVLVFGVSSATIRAQGTPAQDKPETSGRQGSKEGASAGGDWPQFRGVRRDGVSLDTGLLRRWPAGGPTELWRTALGEGFSGISAVGRKLFTMYAKGDDEFVVALDAGDGGQLWRYRIDSKWRDRFGNGPRSTPTFDRGRVYALSARGTLVALDASAGKVIWAKNLPAAYGAEPPTWGYAGSPLVEGDLLLVDVGGKNGSSIVAFDVKDGREIWRSQDDKAGYSAPVAITVGGIRQVVFFTGTRVVALDPTDGALHWAVPWKTSWDVNAATPIFIAPDKIFLSSGYDVGATLLRVESAQGKATISEVWKTREMKNQYSSSVLHAGHLYGFDDKTLRCIDAATGATKWKVRGYGHGSLIYADGQLIVLGDRGTLALVAASPDAFRENSRSQPFEGKTWTGPTLHDGRLFLRDENEMIALGVSE